MPLAERRVLCVSSKLKWEPTPRFSGSLQKCVANKSPVVSFPLLRTLFQTAAVPVVLWVWWHLLILPWLWLLSTGYPRVFQMAGLGRGHRGSQQLFHQKQTSGFLSVFMDREHKNARQSQSYPICLRPSRSLWGYKALLSVLLSRCGACTVAAPTQIMLETLNQSCPSFSPFPQVTPLSLWQKRSTLPTCAGNMDLVHAR